MKNVTVILLLVGSMAVACMPAKSDDFSVTTTKTTRTYGVLGGMYSQEPQSKSEAAAAAAAKTNQQPTKNISPTSASAKPSTAYNAQIQAAITKFKAKNYVGCIQDLEPISKKDPANAVVHYYLGSSYMNIGNKDMAMDCYNKVISLNTTPALTSYSIQAVNCLQSDNATNCSYQKLNADQIKGLVQNPTSYLEELKNVEVKMPKTYEDQEINKLINKQYKDNIHPEAKRTIINTQIERERGEVNAAPAKSDIPTDEEIANAVKTLAKIGYNPYYNSYGNNQNSELAMLYSNNNQNNNFLNMLPFIMGQSESGKKQLSPEMVQAMMMSQMMPDFNYDSNSRY